MATITPQELRNRILIHLGVLAAGEEARSEDSTLVDAAYTCAHAELRQRGLAPFASTAVPDWAEFPFRDYIASKMRGVFGASPQRRAELEAGEHAAVSSLQQQTRVRANGARIKTRYF